MQSEESKRRIKEKLRREAGPHLMEALCNDSVIEILLNADGNLWIEYLGGSMVNEARIEPSAAESLIASVASYYNVVVNRDHPILECEFPLDGSRFEAVIPPIVEGPAFSIRKRALRTHTLGDYVESGIMSEAHKHVIMSAISDRKNILVVGGTGTGKTTLTNALIASTVEVWADHRLVILEDTREIQCQAKNFLQMKTSETICMNDLLRATLRLRPDRIIVGEVRGGEALALLKAWNTGHPGGVATLHANNARAGLVRLEQLISEALMEGAAQHMPKLIAEAVDLIVVISKVENSRKITEVAEVNGFDRGDYSITER